MRNEQFTVRIERQDHPSKPPYWQTFVIDHDPGLNITSVLQRISATPVMKEGLKAGDHGFTLNRQDNLLANNLGDVRNQSLFDGRRITMAVQIGAKPLAGFDRPMEMLTDCHRRVEHFLDLFIKVESLYRCKALDDEAIRALRAAQMYFRTSAPKHTADEEASLFPRMKSRWPQGDPTLDALQKLEADHSFANELHARIDATVDDWCASPEKLPSIDPAQRLRQDLLKLKEHYAEHIRLEEQEVFPQAAQHLPTEAIAEIGNEMRNRRQT